MSLKVLISEAFEMFRVDHIVYNNQSSKTEEMSRLACRSLLAFTGDMDIKDLTLDKIRRWKEQLQRTRSPNTVRGYIIKLRVVLKYLAQNGYKDIINSEAVGIPKKKKKTVSFLTPEEVTHFIDVAFRALRGYKTINRYRNRALIAFLYSSGVRVSELCSLNRADLREDMSFTITGKGDKPRLCFFDNRAKQYLQDYLRLRTDNNPALFLCDLTGNRITKGVIELMFRRVSEADDIIKPVTPHTMRHSYATDLLRNNTNLLYVSKFLGHSSVQTTEMYTHVVDEDLRAIYLVKHTI